MEKDIVGQAEAIIMGEQSCEQRGAGGSWMMLGVYGGLMLLLVGVIWYVAPHLRAAYQEGQEAQAQAAAKEQAEQEAFSAFYAKPLWERIPQVPVEEVTAFAEDFLRRLGYHLAGELVYAGWSTKAAAGGTHIQHDYYALLDPAWLPLRLRCGPQGYYELRPLSCYIFPRVE